MTAQPGGARAQTYDVLIVGAGFGGLALLHKARQLGLRALVLERAGEVGGVWTWNRYPGARCDVESMQYSYSFDEALQQEWRWSERFAAQPEILAYAAHVAQRFELMPQIRLNTPVTAAHYDEARAEWALHTEAGDTLRARFCIMATGCLSATRVPDIEGLAGFQGRTFHTGDWPHEGVDFSGQRVGVVGTGSSGIQACVANAGPEPGRPATGLRGDRRVRPAARRRRSLRPQAARCRRAGATDPLPRHEPRLPVLGRSHRRLHLRHRRGLHLAQSNPRRRKPSTMNNPHACGFSRLLMSAPRPAEAVRPPRGSRKVAKPHFLESLLPRGRRRAKRDGATA